MSTGSACWHQLTQKCKRHETWSCAQRVRKWGVEEVAERRRKVFKDARQQGDRIKKTEMGSAYGAHVWGGEMRKNL